jgi:hypothetical protein
MARNVWLFAAFALCACVPYSMIEPGIRRESARHLGCPERELVISKYEMGMAGVSSWTAEGCERRFECVRREDGRDRASCSETPDSEEKTSRRVVVDRLSLETECPAEQIGIVSQAAWVRGTETAYRMLACGKSYVCTTAAGRTDCKPALAE